MEENKIKNLRERKKKEDRDQQEEVMGKYRRRDIDKDR